MVLLLLIAHQLASESDQALTEDVLLSRARVKSP